MKSVFLMFILFINHTMSASQQEQPGTPQLSTTQKQIATAGALQPNPKSAAQLEKYKRIAKKHEQEQEKPTKVADAKKSPSLSLRTMLKRDELEINFEEDLNHPIL